MVCTSGAAGLMPGLSTAKSKSVEPWIWEPNSTLMPSRRSSSARFFSFASSLLSRTVTFAPFSQSNRAASIPLIPSPSTTARFPFKSIKFHGYLSFNVANAASEAIRLMIQNRTVTVVSSQPLSSK